MEKTKDKFVRPLAERMRPLKLEEYIGQEKLISDTGIIMQFLKQKNFPLYPFLKFFISQNW